MADTKPPAAAPEPVSLQLITDIAIPPSNEPFSYLLAPAQRLQRPQCLRRRPTRLYEC